MDKKFQPILEAVEFLGETQIAERLQKLIALKEKNCFFLTFWGEFSAGKTSLINTLLGRKLLPVHLSETTAVPTFISYGKGEQAVAWNTDGSGYKIDVDMLLNLWYSADNAEQLKVIDHLDVKIPSKLLKNGLVIVDTPGVNTTVEKHQTAALSALASSGKLVYVLGGPVKQSEISWIKHILENDMDVIFVRTKCDQFNSAEEDPHETLRSEKKMLEEICDREITFYAVSSDNGWEQGMEEFRNRLSMETIDIQGLNETCCRNEASHLAALCQKHLEQRIAELKLAIQGDSDELEARKRACEEKRALLEQERKNSAERIEADEQRTERQAQQKLDTKIAQMRSQFKKQMPIQPHDETYSGVIDQYYTYSLEQAVQTIKETLYDSMNQWVQKSNDELGNVCVDDLTFTSIVPLSYADIEKQNSRTIDMYRGQLEAYKDEIVSLKQQYAQKAQQLTAKQQQFSNAEYDNALQIIEEQLAAIPSTVEMIEVEPEGIQPSQVLAGIGKAADLVMFLLPGEAIVSGAKGALQAVGATEKIAKVAKNIKGSEKALSMMKTIAQNANVIDKQHDIGLLVQNLATRRRGSDKKVANASINLMTEQAGQFYEQARQNHQNGGASGTIFDLISIEYWARKIGTLFDEKPRYVVNQEVENQKNALRHQLMNKQQQTMQQELREQQEMGLIRNEQQRIDWEREQQEKAARTIEKQLRQESAKIHRNALSTYMEKIQREYEKQFSANVKTLADGLSKRFFALALRNMGLYSQTQLLKLEQEITRVEENLKNLLYGTPESMKQHQEDLKQCETMKATLEQFAS